MGFDCWEPPAAHDQFKAPEGKKAHLEVPLRASLKGSIGILGFRGSYKWSYGVPLRASLKGSIGILGFRGSSKWSYKSPKMGYHYSYPTYS